MQWQEPVALHRAARQCQDKALVLGCKVRKVPPVWDLRGPAQGRPPVAQHVPEPGAAASEKGQVSV